MGRVNNKTPKEDETSLLFSFGRFNLKPINIDGEFNNYYKDKDEYIRKISILLGQAMPLLSKEDASLFTDRRKLKALHIHQIHDKREIVEKILNMI